MNALAHFSALLCILWLDMEMWTTYDERLLGVAGVGMIFLYMVLTWLAASTDWDTYHGKE